MNNGLIGGLSFQHYSYKLGVGTIEQNCHKFVTDTVPNYLVAVRAVFEDT